MIKKRNYDKRVWFWIGLAFVLAQMIPYVVLKRDTVVPYHDQLDGEMIAYILRAKHLFKGKFLPEFMGGSLKTALTMPAPGFVLFFLSGHYFAAYIVMHLVVILVAYVGMYLLAREVKNCEFQAMVVAGVFAYLPFLPVYGLSQVGIPLLFWFVLQIQKGKKRIGCLIYGCLYAFCSSLVLVGFAVLGMLFVETCVYAIQSRKQSEQSNKKTLRTQIQLLGCIFCVYVVENFSLLMQILRIGEEGKYVSHKEELRVGGTSFWEMFYQTFLRNTQHCTDYHVWILLGSLIGVLACFLFTRKVVERRVWKGILRIFGWILIMVFIASVWESHLGVALRDRIGVLGSVSISRVLWISPTLWYLLGAMVLGVLTDVFRKITGRRKMLIGATICIQLGMFLLIGGLTLKNGTFPANLCRIMGREYSAISFQEYYGEGVMEQVRDYIYETTGKTQEEYRVLSLGIDPCAAYYHGFYCLDGYSNNYSLEYKHKFRKIIEPELNKSQYLTEYFDNWGNRCYLVYAQIPGYYTFEKYSSYFWCYSINGQAAKEMGAKYILSAVYLTNAEEIGLIRVREEPFETPDSYYAIYLYEFQ